MSKLVKSAALFLVFSFLTLNVFAFEDELTGKQFSNTKEIKTYNPVILDDNIHSSKEVKQYNYVPINDTITSSDKELKKEYKQENFEDLYEKRIIISPNKRMSFDRFKEGDEIELVIAKNSERWNLKKGDKIKARIETISPSSFFGIPEEVIIDNFTINDKKANGAITLRGANRSYWVAPLSTALNVFFCAGVLLYFVKGGKAKLNPHQQFEVFLTEE